MNTNQFGYDAHLERLRGRPGEGLQDWLVNRYMRLIEANLGEKSSPILEIGPGAGRLAQQLIRRGYFYNAVEPTRAMASELRLIGSKQDKSVEIFECPLSEVPETENRKYGLVIAIHVLEHTTNPYSARAFLAKCHDLLATGGRLLIICPDYDSYGDLFYNIDWSHGYETTIPRVRALLEDTGFTVETVRGMRASFTNILAKTAIAPISLLFPIGLIDQITNRVFSQRLLASGFAVGFLKRNVLALAQKDTG
jgi:SAM-dependent methyltransferase